VAGEPPQTLVRYAYEDDTALKPSALIRPSVNPQGEHRLEHHYNPQGQPIRITEHGYRPEADGSYSPIQRTTQLEYNETGQLSQIDGPREEEADQISLSYDDQQRLSQLKTPDGRTLQVTQYDPYGRPQQIHSSGQAQLSLTYNSRGKVTQVSQGGQRVNYEYDAAGNLSVITDPDGKQVSLDYDPAGRATGIEDSNGNRIEQTLDTEGRLTQRSLSDARGQLLATVSYLYDAQGRLAASETPRGQTHYRYDETGQLSEVEDPQGHTTEMDYNGLGQLLALTEPGNRVTRLHYDEQGQPIGLTDPRENTTQITKDDFGNLISQHHPDTGEVRYAYDRAGNRTQKTDAQGTTTHYRYDAANRLIEETHQDNTTTLDYDPHSGHLAQLTDDHSHQGFDYDDQGRLIQHSRHIDGHRFITTYAYNTQGKLSQKTLPDGQTLTYHYYREGNQKGQLRAITRQTLLGLRETPLVGEIDQDPSDGETGLTFGNGLRETRDHDKLGRTSAIDHSKQLKLQYQYDEQGRITGIDYNGILQNYDYDPLGRLTQAETKLGSYRYDYDSLGNRTHKEHTAQAGTTTTQSNQYPDPGEGNRLLSQGAGDSQSYRYNPSGSPEQIGERVYEYDTHQRPVRLYQIDENEQKTLIAEYAYNRFGERIKKVTYGVQGCTNATGAGCPGAAHQSKRPKVTYYLYDGHQLTAEADEDGEITAQYLYQHHRPILKLEGKTAYAIHTDHLGAPRAVTDEDQETVWQADYSPFGLIDIQTQTIALNLRLPGQYEDQETGTYYNYQRDYDPSTGRYLTSDPIGLKGGLNTYAYVGGNPINAIDPLGLDWVMIDGVRHWIPDDQNGVTDPDNLSDLYPMPGTPEINTEELIAYLDALERGAYGDQLIEDFAHTGAPTNTGCEDERDLSADFASGIGHLAGGRGQAVIVYGDTLNGILAEFYDMPVPRSWGSIVGWLRTGERLNQFAPGLSEGEVEALGRANAYLPSHTVEGERQGMQLALPTGSTDEQIAEELRASLGSLLTEEDIAAVIASLPEDREGPLLVDIYALYQELLARYQTRLHSDDWVWNVEVVNIRAQEALNAHIADHGESLDCSGNIQMTDVAVCQRRADLESAADTAMQTYIDAIVEVNNEMIDAGMMTLMDADESRQTQSLAARLFAATSVAVIGAILPMTVEEVAFDAATYGLGRIRRVGDAIDQALDRVRGTGRIGLDWVRNVSDSAVQRIRDFRRGRVPKGVGNTGEFILSGAGKNNFIYAELNKNGVIDFAIEAGEGASIRGGELFKAMMSHYGSNVKGIAGNWSYGTNLAKVNELTASGMSLQNAISITWTGNQAAKYGFTSARITEAIGSPGNYKKISTIFE
jgi:RHS repeat-associated protein